MSALADSHRMDAPPRRIAVFRALQLGDMLCAVPALRSLRAGWPQAEITLIGLPWARAFARRFARYVDRFIEFPGHREMPEQPPRRDRWVAYVEAARARAFDLALQMHGSGSTTNRLLVELGAKRTAGFFVPGAPVPDPATFLPWREHEREVLRLVRLARHLGLPDRGLRLEWPRAATDEDAHDMLASLPETGPIVVVHPGARLASRRWPVARFAAVADRLAAAGCGIVITGSSEERELAAALEASMRAPALNLAGKTGLDAVAAVIGRASLLVCNDTGVSHLAAALGTPSVVVSCGSDPQRWAPLDASRHAVVFHALDCRPCMHSACPIGHPCATAVTVEAVAAQADAMLARFGARRPQARATP